MKRDMDLIRQIVLHVEEHDNLSFDIPDYDEQVIAYHVRLLVEAGLLHAATATTLDGRIHLQDVRTALTWPGHEFLDAARDEGRWTEAKRLTKEKAGSITMTALTQILTRLMMQALGM